MTRKKLYNGLRTIHKKVLSLKKKKKIKILKLTGHEYQSSHSDGSGKDNLSLNYGFKKITFIIEYIYNLVMIIYYNFVMINCPLFSVMTIPVSN